MNNDNSNDRFYPPNQFERNVRQGYVTTKDQQKDLREVLAVLRRQRLVSQVKREMEAAKEAN